MASLKGMQKELESISRRNARVEAEKAWETSYFRRILLMLFTYLAIGFYLQAIEVREPWLNAIVPAVALMLSTLTLPYFRKLWLKHIYNKN